MEILLISSIFYYIFVIENRVIEINFDCIVNFGSEGSMGRISYGFHRKCDHRCVVVPFFKILDGRNLLCVSVFNVSSLKFNMESDFFRTVVRRTKADFKNG